MAIDYGEKRVGMAWTDMLRIAITPLPTVETRDFETKIKDVLTDNEVGTIVFGYPLHMDGNLTKVALKVDKICAKLAKSHPDLELAKMDEAFSSKDARIHLINLGKKKTFREKKGNIDQASAVLILKEYLDQNL